MRKYGSQRICEECGDNYIGSSSARYCVDCKLERMKDQQKAYDKKRYEKAR